MRPLNKAAKPGPGRPRTRTIDPNWDGLKRTEGIIYGSIPADVDMDELEDKINAAREARGTEDARQYAEALRDLLSYHYDKFKADESYSSDDLRESLKADELLSSDARSLARALGALHDKNRIGNRPKTLNQLLDEAKQKFKDNRADVRGHIQALGGDWDTKGAIKLAEDMESEFQAEFTRQGAHSEEATFRAKRKVAQVLNDMATDPKKSYIVLSSQNENASIKLFMDPKSRTMNPVVDETEIVKIRNGITAARANRFNKDPINVNVMANDSTTAMPKVVSDQLDDGDLALTYFGGDGIFIYPERVNQKLSEGIDADWFSTETLDSTDLYKHLIVHETGHLQMYKLWGEGKSSGRSELAEDFKKFKVQSKQISEYGNESISESFAEQYAKYLITGDASPEFLELLSSKGLTKAQINKKWRSNFESNFQQSKFHSSFFGFMDSLQKEIETNGGPREYVGQEAANYNDDYRGGNSKFGTRNTNLVARLMGFRSKKPETVETLTRDDKIVYRGVSASGGKDGWELHNEFRTSDEPWWGFGYFGNGQYSSKSQSEAQQYGDRVAMMRVKDDAKIYIDRATSEFGFDKLTMNEGLDLRSLHTELFRTNGILEEFVLNEINPDLDPSIPEDARTIKAEVKNLRAFMGLRGSYDVDRTILAAMLGFQGVEVAGNQNTSYALILDRSMMQMLVPPGFGA